MPIRPRSAGVPLLALTLALSAAACGDDEPTIDGSVPSRPGSVPDATEPAASATCGEEIEEPLDPNSSRHVFPGAAEPTYSTDPPTSGPHQLGKHPAGALDAPIPRPIQVAMLEGGAVLIQYRDAGARPVLAPLAQGDVTIAPNPNLPAAVVATAWLHKLVCTGTDAGDLQVFVSTHAGKPAGTH